VSKKCESIKCERKNARVKYVSKNMMMKTVKEKKCNKKMRIKIFRAQKVTAQNVSVIQSE